MADAGFFRGTSTEQDARFFNKQKKLLKQLKFPPNIGTKVDMLKVSLDTIKPWITQRINELLGFDDDVVTDFLFNLLETDQFPDPKVLQMNLTGFLNGKNARIFMQELWDLLVSAQDNIGGIPTKFLEQKKEEIRLKKMEQERIQANLKRQEEVEREILEQRQREYEERQARRKEEEERKALERQSEMQRAKERALQRLREVEEEKHKATIPDLGHDVSCDGDGTATMHHITEGAGAPLTVEAAPKHEEKNSEAPKPVTEKLHVSGTASDRSTRSSRFEPKSKSCSPQPEVKQQRSRSHSPLSSQKQQRSRSRTPQKQRRSRSRTPQKQWRSRSRSPQRQRRSRSRSPRKQRRSRSPQKQRRSRSPRKQRRSRSRSPRASVKQWHSPPRKRYRHSSSRSPPGRKKRRGFSRSPSPRHHYYDANVKHQRTRSYRSPPRRRHSPSPLHKRRPPSRSHSRSPPHQRNPRSSRIPRKSPSRSPAQSPSPHHKRRPPNQSHSQSPPHQRNPRSSCIQRRSPSHSPARRRRSPSPRRPKHFNRSPACGGGGRERSPPHMERSLPRRRQRKPPRDPVRVHSPGGNIIKSPIRLSPPRTRGLERKYVHRGGSPEKTSPVRTPPHKRPEYNMSSSESSSSVDSFVPSVSSRSSSPVSGDSAVEELSRPIPIAKNSLSSVSGPDRSRSVSPDHSPQRLRKQARKQSQSPSSRVRDVRGRKTMKGAVSTISLASEELRKQKQGGTSSQQSRGRRRERAPSPKIETLSRDLSIGSSFSSSSDSSCLPSPPRPQLNRKPSFSPSLSPSRSPSPPPQRGRKRHARDSPSPLHRVKRRGLSPQLRTEVSRTHRTKRRDYSSLSASPVLSSASSPSPLPTPIKQQKQVRKQRSSDVKKKAIESSSPHREPKKGHKKSKKKHKHKHGKKHKKHHKRRRTEDSSYESEDDEAVEKELRERALKSLKSKSK